MSIAAYDRRCIRDKGGKNRPTTLDTPYPRSYIMRALSSGF
jgi:hypothetical protein